MPVRRRLTIYEDRTDTIADDVAAYASDVFFEAGRRVWGKQEKPIRAALAKTAPKRRGRWAGWSPDPAANERARKWWFWAVNTGKVETDGRHYIRSGNIEKAFDVRYEQRDDRIDLLVLATKAGTGDDGKFKYRWVLGTFDARTGSRWQIPGHKATGWKWIRDTVDRLFDQFEEQVRKEYEQILTERRSR